MKVSLVLKVKGGYLVTWREIDNLNAAEVCAGVVVGSEFYSPMDRLGRAVAALLEAPQGEGGGEAA